MTPELDWKIAGWVTRGKQRRKVLKSLDSPMMPSDIARKHKISLAHASKIVRELASKKLVECINEELKLGRIYKRTNKGNKIVKYLKTLD